MKYEFSLKQDSTYPKFSRTHLSKSYISLVQLIYTSKQNLAQLIAALGNQAMGYVKPCRIHNSRGSCFLDHALSVLSNVPGNQEDIKPYIFVSVIVGGVDNVATPYGVDSYEQI